MRTSSTTTSSIRAISTLVLALLLVLSSVPTAAYAAESTESAPSFVSFSSKKSAGVASAPTAKEKKAYNRALKACLDYKHQANPIVVDLSDLKLTTAQARHVQYLLHSNGELFWINCYDDSNFTAKQFKIPCTASDETITRQRAQVDKAVAKVLKRISSNMDNATKILTLHDYLIDLIDYEASQKTAYTGLVLHKADCFGYTQTMDLVLRRAGFTTDTAYNLRGDHAWNLVKLGGKWYHIDLTWDHGYTGYYFWKKTHCHLYLLQSDARMHDDGYTEEVRGNWWAHNKGTSNTYYAAAEPDGTLFTENKYKLYLYGFTVDGVKYKALGTNKVQVVGLGTAKKSAARVVLPRTVRYKGKTYKVAGIAPQAFKGTRVKTLEIYATAFTKARVANAFKGSRVYRVKLMGSARKYQSYFATWFTQQNTGARRAVKIYR